MGPGGAAKVLEHRRSLRSRTSTVDHTDNPVRLRRFDRPVLLVTGIGTAPFLRRIHDLLAAHMPNAVTAEMPSGHAPHIVSMDEFLAELEAFQASADR